MGEMPASTAITINLADQLLHIWDLARALGRSYTIDAEAAESILAVMQQIMQPQFRGPGGLRSRSSPSSGRSSPGSAAGVLGSPALNQSQGETRRVNAVGLTESEPSVRPCDGRVAQDLEAG